MAFLGMRGTGDWSVDERPKSFREGILYYWPNGQAPLTAILSKMASEKVTDPEFSWWTKALPGQYGDVTDIYTDAAMSTAYASGGTSGSVLYVKCGADLAGELKAGHIVMIRSGSNISLDRVARVEDVTVNGASSSVKVTLLKADTGNALAGSSLKLVVIGSAYAEGALRPDAVAYDPVKLFNYTQIMRTSLELTRTAQETKLRTADAYKRAKKEALELHSIEMEKAFIFGNRSERIVNGKPLRTTGGLLEFILTNVPGNVFDFTLDTSSDFKGKSWTAAGWDYLEYAMETLFKYGDASSKLVLCGTGFLRGLGRLVKGLAKIELTSAKESYGISVKKWITTQGEINLMTHPLFSQTPGMSNAGLVLEPKNLKYRYITDTMFKADPTQNKGGGDGTDGIKEEFLTEAGLEALLPATMGFLGGIGQDNTLT